MAKSKTFLLDTMVLINFTERCEAKDLFEYFAKAGIGFSIVEEVEKEFKRGIKPLGQLRYEKHKKNGMINIIPNNAIEIDVEKMTYLVNRGFGRGELFSSLYFVKENNLDFVSDEKLVQDVLNKKFKKIITKTYDLLQILVENQFITENEGEQIFSEMIRNGLWIKV